MFRTVMVFVLIINVITIGSVSGRVNHDFYWFDDEPILREALQNDILYADGFGLARENCDPDIALELYGKYLDERDPTSFQRAQVLARMGMIWMQGREDNDPAKAQEYFREALELAGDDILSWELFFARTNYLASLSEQPRERFEEFMAFLDWLDRMDEDDNLFQAVANRRPDFVEVIRKIDMETGEETVMPLEEAGFESSGYNILSREADRIRVVLESFRETQLPVACVDAALQHPEPAAAMERLIERTEGTPIAELARENMDKARMYQEIREESLRIMAEQEDAE